MLATQIRQKDGIFYFGSVRAPELLAKVRFISRFYGEGEEIAPARISQEDEIAQFIAKIERNENQESGDYDLEGLFVRLGYAIDKIGAKRVVLDTIENLFAGLGG